MNAASHQRVPWLRALAVWGIFILVESVHGTARTLWLEPRVGIEVAGRIGFAVGTALCVVIPLLFARWLGARTTRQCLLVGALWLVATLAFEVALGRFVRGYSWGRIADEYRVDRGALMPYGLLVLALMPWIAARVRGLR
ncbi:MAG: hypothetical protein NTY35_02020 [Planctomycetota bacterium]|nr:hypothetical protein [Planctomycetota bacterium]